MKKRLAKILTVIAAFALILPVFALVGCTDDKDEPRTLDGVELSIVGTWEDPYGTYEFKSDGTYTYNTAHAEFFHDGEGIETDGDERGHYVIIKLERTNNRLALFDINQDKFCWIINGEIKAFDYPSNLIRQ